MSDLIIVVYWGASDAICTRAGVDHGWLAVSAVASSRTLWSHPPAPMSTCSSWTTALWRPPRPCTSTARSTLPGVALTAYDALIGSQPLKSGHTVLIMSTGGVSMCVPPHLHPHPPTRVTLPTEKRRGRHAHRRNRRIGNARTVLQVRRVRWVDLRCRVHGVRPGRAEKPDPVKQPRPGVWSNRNSARTQLQY